MFRKHFRGDVYINSVKYGIVCIGNIKNRAKLTVDWEGWVYVKDYCDRKS